jgi:hypothetical protein
VGRPPFSDDELAGRARRTYEEQPGVRPNAAGYTLEAAIPTAVLDAFQKQPWQEFRLNVCVNSTDRPNGDVTKHWWCPDWRSPENQRGSGTFKKAM